MTKEELAQKIKDSNYTCDGINCSECISVNGFGCCLQCDKELFVSLVLPAKSKKDKLEKQIEELSKENAELKEELKNWKDEWQEQVQKAIDEGYARTLQTIQLTKATALLKKFIETSNPIYFDEDRQKVKVEAERFLKGENIILEDVQAGNSPFDADEVFNKEMKAYSEEK